MKVIIFVLITVSLSIIFIVIFFILHQLVFNLIDVIFNRGFNMDEKFNKGDKISWVDIKQSRGRFNLSIKKGEIVKDDGKAMIKIKYRNGKEVFIERKLVKGAE